MSTLTAPVSHHGELVEFDIRALARQARPACEGGGDGVPVDTVQAMLDRMIEVLGFSGASQKDHDIQVALKMVRQVARDQAQRLHSAQHLLTDFLQQSMANEAEAEETLETLQLTLQPLKQVRVWR